MRGMEIEVLLDLLQQATREFHRSSLTIRSLITVITEKTIARGNHPQDRA